MPIEYWVLNFISQNGLIVVEIIQFNRKEFGNETCETSQTGQSQGQDSQCETQNGNLQDLS